MITIDEFRKMDGRIRSTPIGAIRLVVGVNTLYHFYSDKMPLVLVDNMHTHPFSFKSTVIKGGIQNQLYRYEISTEDAEYNLRLRSWPITSPMKIIHEHVNVEKILSFNTYEGASYNIDCSVMHKVELLTPKLITFVEGSENSSDVFFVMKKGVDYTKEQLHNLKTQDECWEIVEYTLAP